MVDLIVEHVLLVAQGILGLLARISLTFVISMRHITLRFGGAESNSCAAACYPRSRDIVKPLRSTKKPDSECDNKNCS